tara:strand:- start:615 stop:2033 length:1419 start_codon:yes stop_codon:yes gene_type:complete
MSDLKIFKRLENHQISMPVSTFKSHLNEMKADVVFQAGRWKRWTPEIQSEFIRSMFTGEAPSAIVLSDNQECMEYYEDLSISDWEYFKAWLGEGIKYLIVDGHNRKVTIAEFLESKVTIPKGYYNLKYTTHEGDVLSFEGNLDSHNNTFKTMPSKLREFFLAIPINIQTYTNSSRDELSDLFNQINSGKELNHAERRNAKTSNIARVVRDMATEFYDIFVWKKTNAWLSEKEANRRSVDAYLAKMIFMWFNDDLKSNCQSEDNLWDMYGVDSPQDKTYKEGDRALRRFFKEIGGNPKLRALPAKNCLFDLWIIWRDLVKDNYSFNLDKVDDLIMEYITVCSDLHKDPTTYESPSGFSPWKDPKSYATIVSGLQASNNSLRNKFILEKMDFTPYIEKNRKRVVNNWTKLHAAVQQDFKTPAGKNIKPETLQSGEYHKGHKHTPHKDGGKATLENTVVQTERENLTTGAKPVEV